MNTLLPVFQNLRALCLSKLEARGWVRRRRQRTLEIQLEFPWR